MPAIIFAFGFLPFPTVMAKSAIFPFFLNYLAFGASFIPCIYLLTHLFDEIETGIKWVGPLTLLCLIVIPVGIAALIALLIKGDYT